MTSSYDPNAMTMAAIDGRDALAFVILRPGPNGDRTKVVAEAGANGISKEQAAKALRQIADMWDAETAAQS
jgi:hypothetical protein